MYIVCIYNPYFMYITKFILYIQKIWIAYILDILCICYVYCMYIPWIFPGLYWEHIIPAMVHRYTQVLQRPDLIWHDRNEVAHPIMSNEAVASDFRRLANRRKGVVVDTSMLTISPEYAAHSLEVYVKKTENAKFTGDRVRFLMLTLPFVVLDLIAPEVFQFT